MTEYLTKEEIKQWRSSVEKITLEEYAARLGKSIEEEKETHDLADIIYNGENVVQTYNYSKEDKSIATYKRPETISSLPKPEKIDIAKPQKIEVIKPKEVKKQVIEPEVQKTPEPIKQVKIEKTVKTEPVQVKPVKKEIETPKVETQIKKVAPSSTSGDINITFKKNLTEREEKVLDHFKQNRGKIVYAKELAELLNLKRDYIYKYIKNLRAKIVEDVLENADKGGFVLK